MYNYMPYGQSFNPNVLKKLSKIHDEIEKESKKDSPDKKKLLELEMQKMCMGMELNTGNYNNNYRRYIPW